MKYSKIFHIKDFVARADIADVLYKFDYLTKEESLLLIGSNASGPLKLTVVIETTDEFKGPKQ